MKKRYAGLFIIIILLSPLGLLADGTAWGEWGADELREQLGFIPAGIQLASDYGRALLPDYTVPGLGESKHAQAAGYSLSAIVGSILVYCSIILFAELVKRFGKAA